MAREIAKWEAETDPPTVHDSMPEAVAAELAALFGVKAKAESETNSLAFGIAREMVSKPDAFIGCLSQLVAKTSPTS